MARLQNVWLKFLSIAIAALLWLVVAGDRTVERTLRVPIEFQNLPSGLELVGAPLDSMDVRVKGSSGTLSRLGTEDLAVIIDLRSVRAGRRLFHMTPSSVKAPYGVDIVQVGPATLSFDFEHAAIRILEVRPSIEGQPALGFEVTSVVVDPPTVEVIGPESSLRGLDGAMTEPISVANATRVVREVVTIGVADPAVRLRTPRTADVSIQILPGDTRQTFANLPIQIKNLDGARRSRLAPPTVSVAVRGTQAQVKALDPRVIDVHVDAGGLGPGEHELQVAASVAPGLTVEAVVPKSVRLRLITP